MQQFSEIIQYFQFYRFALMSATQEPFQIFVKNVRFWNRGSHFSFWCINFFYRHVRWSSILMFAEEF